MDESVFRAQLVELLRGGEAHVKAEDALKGVGAKARNVRPSAETRSIWEELEHMRLAQEDILRYTLDPKWESPAFPAGYWPPEDQTVTDEMWKTSVDTFFSDLEAVVHLAEDQGVDLSAKVPHGEWRTYLRQILLVADHNTYHLGQIVQARKLLGDWPV